MSIGENSSNYKKKEYGHFRWHKDILWVVGISNQLLEEVFKLKQNFQKK